MTRLTWKETLLSLLSGILMALAMPGIGATPLAFCSLIPLFAVLHRRGGFWPGALFGFAFFAIDLRWIVTLARFHPIVIAGYILLAIYFAAGCGILGAVLTWRGRSRTITWLLLAPALFTLAEALRTVGPLGMGFSTLYSTLYRAPLLIQSAAVLGPWFISGIIAAINGSLFLLVLRKRARFGAIAAGGVLLLLAFALIPPPDQDGERLRVVVVSSKVRQEEKLDGRNLSSLTERYLQLGNQAIAESPDVIVFPESILPAYILSNETLTASFADLAKAADAEILLGTGVYRDRNIYNTVVQFSEAGQVTGSYSMVRPVPFGEYIPGRSVLEAIGLGAWAKTFLPVDLSRGDGYSPVGRWGTPICFESTFASPARALTRNGAEALVTVTNDAWFDESSELAAHFACAVFRAVENRRWTIQSANGGISGLISPTGRIIASLDGEGVIAGDITLQTRMSLYTRWGDWIVLVLACVIAGAVLIRRMFARENEDGGKIR